MRDSFLEIFNNVIKLKIEGKNINRFLRRLIANKVELLGVKIKNNNEMVIKIYQKDYEKVLEIKSIYDIHFENVYGLIKIKRLLSINKILIVSFLLCFGILKLLSSIVFKIEVIHIDPYIRSLVYQELSNHGVRENRFKWDYSKLEKIKESILNKHRDKLEWIEIEEIGTKYIVRIEERKINKLPEKKENRHIIAAKDAIIKDIDAHVGEAIKNINDYVRAGDIIISGKILTPRSDENLVAAEGKVYGEVWYQATIEYPFVVHEENETGRKKYSLVFYFLNSSFDIFGFKDFKNKKIIRTPILKNNLFPFGIALEEQIETRVKTEINTYSEAYLKAMEVGREKIEKNLKDGEYIISENSLKIDVKDSKIIIDMFYSVYEDITDYQKIIEEQIVE